LAAPSAAPAIALGVSDVTQRIAWRLVRNEPICFAVP
jgi:hypothetical protein